MKNEGFPLSKLANVTCCNDRKAGMNREFIHLGGVVILFGVGAFVATGVGYVLVDGFPHWPKWALWTGGIVSCLGGWLLWEVYRRAKARAGDDL